MGMPVTGGPFAEKKFIEIKGRKTAYIDEGEGPPIVFQHGNPTSSRARKPPAVPDPNA
jgi:pimeloyl-ACP methyl ester carboxylesterase